MARTADSFRPVVGYHAHCPTGCVAKCVLPRVLLCLIRVLCAEMSFDTLYQDNDRMLVRAGWRVPCWRRRVFTQATLHTQGGAPLRILSFAEIRAQVEQTGGPLAEVPTRPSAQRHSSASSRRGGGARDGRKSAGSPHGVPGEARGALHATNSSSSMKRRRRVRGTEQGSSSEAGRTGSPLPP